MGRLITDNEFYCCKCGQKGLPIVRTAGSEREAGHLKKLWCIRCKQEVNHAECIPFSKYTYQEFLLEFKYGNFDEQQNRKEKFGIFKSNLIKEGVDIYEEEK